MSQEKVAETFDRWADEGRDEGMEEGHGDVVRQVIEKMEVGPGERVLDLGCGNGWATRILAQTNAGVQAIGVDASKKMIARADDLHSFTIRARYDHGSFEELDFKDAEFDRIFSMEALYYAGDLEKALGEAFRVLKPGGSADVLVDYFEESPASADWGDVMDLSLHRLDEAGWCAAFEAAGFTGVRAERVIDSRGAGGDVDECEPTDEAKKALHEAGTLWIHAEKA
jgi:ubiquinone/menaquinone biosynthesis C-methylase UbiE